MVKKLKYFFEAIFIYISFLISKILGLYLSRIIFSNIFKLLGPLVRSNKIINNNLKKLPKEVPVDKKKIIVSNMWSNYGMTFVEYMFLKKFRNGNSHIKIDNEKDLDQILTNNKQVIFVSGHFANFEVMSMEINKKKINLATIYRHCIFGDIPLHTHIVIFTSFFGQASALNFHLMCGLPCPNNNLANTSHCLTI